eukprot:1079012-Pelagomonas_calceolata.AAC.1
MEQPYLQQVSVQTVHDFLLQHNNKLFSFVSEVMDIMLTGEDQSQADQPESLAEGSTCCQRAHEEASLNHPPPTRSAQHNSFLQTTSHPMQRQAQIDRWQGLRCSHRNASSRLYGHNWITFKGTAMLLPMQARKGVALQLL